MLNTLLPIETKNVPPFIISLVFLKEKNALFIYLFWFWNVLSETKVFTEVEDILFIYNIYIIFIFCRELEYRIRISHHLIQHNAIGRIKMILFIPSRTYQYRVCLRTYWWETDIVMYLTKNLSIISKWRHLQWPPILSLLDFSQFHNQRES